MREALREGAVVLATFEGGVFTGLRVVRDPRREDEQMAMNIGKYRMRGVEVSGSETRDNRFPFVEVMCEVVMGPELGTRVKWRGYFHTPDTGKRSLEALRVMGWRGRGRADLEALRRGSMGGIGRAEFVGEVQHDIAQKNGREVRYPRVAFVNALGRLQTKAETEVSVSYDLDALFTEEEGTEGDAVETAAPAGSFDPDTGEVRGAADDFPTSYGGADGKAVGDAIVAKSKKKNGRAEVARGGVS
jgi:hypothetical protein